MRGTVYEERSETGLCLSPDTLWNLFLLLLSHAFDSSTDGVYRQLFSVARLRTKTKVKTVLVLDMLFADDPALATHSETAMQRPINKFGIKCENFGLTESASRKPM